METELFEAAQAFCLGILGKGRCGDLPYHNPAHTMEVVDHARIIGTTEGLSGPDLIPLLLAALFHDTGINMTFSHHEKVSARTAVQFLVENNYPPAGIAMVEQCILSTKLPQNPTTPIERVLCDADLFHLSSADFSDHNKRLRIENQKFRGEEYSDREWLQYNINFLKAHSYHTQYGQSILQAGKELNIVRLENKLLKLSQGIM